MLNGPAATTASSAALPYGDDEIATAHIILYDYLAAARIMKAAGSQVFGSDVKRPVMVAIRQTNKATNSALHCLSLENPTVQHTGQVCITSPNWRPAPSPTQCSIYLTR